MADILQLLVAGLATGGIYALVAIGFTLLWQTSQTINFAQGEFVMLPAFFVLIGMSYFGLSFWPAVALGAVVSMIVLGLLFAAHGRSHDPAWRAAAGHRDHRSRAPVQGSDT